MKVTGCNSFLYSTLAVILNEKKVQAYDTPNWANRRELDIAMGNIHRPFICQNPWMHSLNVLPCMYIEWEGRSHALLCPVGITTCSGILLVFFSLLGLLKILHLRNMSAMSSSWVVSINFMGFQISFVLYKQDFFPRKKWYLFLYIPSFSETISKVDSKRS